MSDPGVAISIQRVRKSFGDVRAVDGISLDIAEGEFLTLLGPSGCGKTTTMRMIAGFEEPDEGTILLRGTDVVGVPPNKREVNMCFQHYALFPHMTVERNIEYGLKLKKVPKGDRQRDRRGDARDRADSPACNSASPASSRAGSSSAWRSRARS